LGRVAGADFRAGACRAASFADSELVAAMVISRTENEPLLIAVVGPTASGKTALSIALAEAVAAIAGGGGEIVSCDSVAVYRELELGTAKPSAAERARVPHHLIDIAAPTDTYTAGDYSLHARAAIAAIHARGHLPIVAGGTGLYLRALLEGLFAGPQRDEALRDELRATAEAEGPAGLHARLAELDPIAAGKIHVNDTPKIIRALEVCLTTEKPISEIWQGGRDALTGYRKLRIGLEPPREMLKQRINHRAAAMFDAGLIEETRGLLARYGDNCRALTSLGSAQAVAVLRGEMTETGAITAAQSGHRQYAKRQRTWFRREPEVHWLQGFGDEAETIASAIELVKAQAKRD
jgi:tRNA dimethylallyltransferase